MADINTPVVPKLYQRADMLIAIGIIIVILMIIIPLPDIMLDIFIAVNLMSGIIILLSVQISCL